MLFQRYNIILLFNVFVIRLRVATGIEGGTEEEYWSRLYMYDDTIVDWNIEHSEINTGQKD